MVHRVTYYNCHNCKRSFEYGDLEMKAYYYGDVKIKTKVCPFCGSSSWSSYEERKKLNRYLIPNM